MDEHGQTPFESIESAQEYIGLLCEAIQEARQEIEAEIAATEQGGNERRKQALQLAAYNLGKLSAHMMTSHRILNDLRTLRRLLFSEQGEQKMGAAAEAGASEAA